MEVAAEAELRELELAGADALARADEGVVLRMVEVVDVVDVDPELAGEDLGVERRVGGAAVAVEPGEVGEGERLRRRRPGRGCRGHGGLSDDRHRRRQRLRLTPQHGVRQLIARGRCRRLRQGQGARQLRLRLGQLGLRLRQLRLGQLELGGLQAPGGSGGRVRLPSPGGRSTGRERLLRAKARRSEQRERQRGPEDAMAGDRPDDG